MTMSTVSAIVAGIQDVVGAVAGVRMAPDVPPEQIAGGDVFGIVYPASGTFELITAGREQGTHVFHLMLATPRRHLRTDWARVITLGDTVQRALLSSPTLGGTVHNVDAVRYTFGDLEWGGQQLFGWLFELETISTGTLS